LKLISYSDIIELYEKIANLGLASILKKFRIRKDSRAESYWNQSVLPETNWWNIPLVRQRWNHKMTGNADSSYILYLDKFYFKKNNSRLLSIGCGTGSQEILLSSTGKFSEIIAIDIASHNIFLAKERASKLFIDNINFLQSNFSKDFCSELKFDFIFFHFSLHHLENIKDVFSKCHNLLNNDGYLIFVEYVGPNRIDWSNSQLNIANNLLNKIPKSKRRYSSSGFTKRKQTTPGLIRMLLSDPSESIESENILKYIDEYFECKELKGFGGNILAPLLKGISHHFISEDESTKQMLYSFFEKEDEFLKNNKDDHFFGIYKKREI
jgi:ubiquinone/menaquinone biosynthesis C-methylase UbiE